MHTSPSGKRYIGITSVKTYNRWGAKGQRYIYNKNKEVTYYISESKKGKPWSAKRREAFKLSKKKGLVT